MNVEDYKKIYSVLKSNSLKVNTLEDIISELDVSCYDAVKQAIFDYHNNAILLKKMADDSKECSSLKECLSYSSYLGMVLSYKNPDFLDLFIEENNEALSKFKIIKFLGSGQVGDAWELENGNILKIFDNSVQNDIRKYEQAQEFIEKNEGLSYDISIYDIGRLRVPDKYFGIKTPSFSYIRTDHEDRPEYEPAYVILERLTTYSSMVGSYAKSLSGSNELPDVLKESGLPEDNHFQNAIRYNNEPDFVVDIFMTYIGDIIIQKAIRGWYENITGFYPRTNPLTGEVTELNDVLDRHTDEIFNRETKRLSRRARIGSLAKIFIEELSHNVDMPEPKFLKAYISILKMSKPDLPDDWLFRLAESTISKLEMGHKDVHTGNVGIRNEGDLSFVYYDS